MRRRMATLAERKYDRALTAFTKAGDLAPEFALTKWKLALFYEAMGDIDRARENFTRYQQLVSDQSAKDEADLHLSTLDAEDAPSTTRRWTKPRTSLPICLTGR